MQIESLAHLYQHPTSSNGPNSTQPTENDPQSSHGLHDRLPSYYTALAPSRTAPWIPPATQQVYNKLPAYITDQPGTSDGNHSNIHLKERINNIYMYFQVLNQAKRSSIWPSTGRVERKS